LLVLWLVKPALPETAAYFVYRGGNSAGFATTIIIGLEPTAWDPACRAMLKP